jgi:FkbM family methyltransferase
MLTPPKTFIKSTLRRWPAAYAMAKRIYGSAAYCLRIPHDPDFAFFRNLRGVKGLFVDVGANAGQSACSLRIFNRTLDILSFEPNQLLEPDLRFTRRLLGSSYRYAMHGLGSRLHESTLYVPMAGRTPHTPWATADRESLERCRPMIERELGASFTIAAVPMEVKRFDDLGLRPVAIKIDVEGCELDVLRGMPDTLERDEPILMIENNSSAPAVVALLQGQGYQVFTYDPRRNTLRQTDKVNGVTNYFACSPSTIARFGANGAPRVVLESSERAEERLAV